ncbi:SDR family NAD(P)-dependent oxidoreductase, partial [Shewanella sp. GutDb-MelDb]|uniref:SDR family NAD(P)-dependent oxidoreductase n=1 Tax=Shewanella sp. GutDb-MelDb TaxID=2058316 RepID=UPI000C7A3227
MITGASKGLGLALSREALNNGYRVVGISRTITDEFRQLVKDNIDNISFHEFDFFETEKISSLAKSLVKLHGKPYALINNAALGHDGVLATMHENDISTLLKVNVEAPILLTKYLSRVMLLNRTGRIINVGSIIGSTGFNGLSVYGASKSALSGFTKSLSRELGKANITVNTLAPGYMETSMTAGLQGDKLDSIKRRSALGRLANVEDAAKAAIFLLSESASSIT